MPNNLTPSQAEAFAAIALGHVRREYPHVLLHVMTGPDDVGPPHHLHPVFHGSLDWHSCAHGYWLLATLLRHNPSLEAAPAIMALFDTMLVPEKIAGECAYFDRPTARGFERPYGWAWLLALHHALRGTRWAAAVAPLAGRIARRFHDYLPLATYPMRVGTHFNTAFALVLAAPWAAAHDTALLALLREKARTWYDSDRNCPAWEPSQDEFLSPALMEAVCRAHLCPEGFSEWFAAFLPALAARQPATLFAPAVVSDRSDGKIAHLDGLNLSRAWCWRELAAQLPEGDTRQAVAEDAAAQHLAAALPHLASDYMGEHWLASFAVLALLPDALTV